MVLELIVAVLRWPIFHPRDTPLMQIPDEVRKCVAFLACKKKSGMEERGTVFFVSEEIGEDPDGYISYAVTARHVIQRISDLGIDGKTYFRMNDRNHGAKYIEMPMSAWIMHDDPTVDVAIAAMEFDYALYDHTTIPTKLFLPNNPLGIPHVNAGCDLFFPGLFAHHKGQKANIPIVRTGTIAAMPGEPVSTKFGDVIAYLAEARSIGGLSGSPVFAFLGPPYIQTTYFIGLIHGHYDTHDSPSIDNIRVGPPRVKEINMGIAVVIPSEAILAVLAKSDFDNYRTRVTAEAVERKKQSLPSPD